MNNTLELNRFGGFYGQATRWGVWDKEHICCTLTAAMGEGGGHISMVVIEEDKDERNIKNK